MSFFNHSLTVSIQKLQDPDNPFDLDHITCSFLINSRPFGVLKAPDFSNSIFIPHILPKDTVQFIFYKNDHQELYGCISFTAKQLLESQEENIQQWATLFDDPEDDAFDGKIGEDDEELPRALLHVTVKKQESLIPPEDESQIHFDIGLKEKGFETNLQQTLDFSSVACVPRYDEHFQKSCDISLISTHNHKILESPEKGPMNIAAVNIEEIQMDLMGSKCPIALERKSSLGSQNHTENSIDDLMVQNENSEIEVRNAQDRATYTTIESTTIMDNKSRLKASLSLNESNLKEFVKMNDCTLPKRLQLSTTQSNIQAECQCDKGIKEIEHLNVNLEARVSELQSLLEKLQSDNNLLHQKEELHVVGFNAMKSELDTCKSAKAGLEKRIAEYEELLNSEKESRTQFEKLAKEKENESLLASQELTTLRSQVNLDETVIQNLQKEIFSLRQKEDESLELNIKLVGTTQKIDYYEEKLGALIEAISIFNIAKTDTQTLEEFVEKVQDLMPLKVKEMEDMQSMNEDLTIRLSICDNKLLADSLLAQIDGLKNTIISLEKERESLKEELNKVTANYMQITTKYMELSDFVTTKKPAQSEQSTTLARSSTPNLKRSNKSKPVLKNESVDDIEAKLIEFTVNHKIQSSLLTRIEYGVYLYGGKKVYLKLQDGQLVVKVGDAYKPFQDFLKPKNSVSSASTPGANNNGSKSNPKNLKLSLKETCKEERSFDQKLKLKMSNYHSVQVDQSQRDLSADISGTSRSISKENARGLVRQLYQTNSTVLDLHNNSMKTLTRLDSNLKLKEILTSRMVDRRLSYGILYKKDKSQRDLTPL